MSTIEQPGATVQRQSDLQEPVAEAVKKYRAFLAGPPDRVVNCALERVLCLDSDLVGWRKQQPTPGEEKHGHRAATVARA